MIKFDKSKFPSKTFLVVDGGLFLKITRSKKWYCVEGLNVDGLVTQGRSFEEAIYMAHDAAELLAQCRAEFAIEEAAKKIHEKKPRVKKAEPARRLAAAV